MVVSEKTPLLQPSERPEQNGKDAPPDMNGGVATDLDHGDAIKAENVGFGRIMRLPTFAGKLSDIFTLKPDTDTEEGRKAAVKKAENLLILLIAVEIIVGWTAFMLRAYLIKQ